MTRNEHRILIVTCFGHFMSHYNMLVFPALILPLSSMLDMKMADVLGLSFWMYLLFGVTALPWGMLGDLWSGKPLMLLMFLGAGLSGLCAAFFMDSPDGLALSLAAIGLFSGIYHPIGMGMISKRVGRLTAAMGYNAVYGGLGLALAPLATGMVTWLSGPKAAYVALGALNLSGLVLIALLPMEEPVVHKKHGSKEENGMVGAFLILLVAMMLGGLAFTGATVMLPAYVELKNTAALEWISSLLGRDVSSNVLATVTASVVYVVGVIGQYVGGTVGERYEHRRTYLTFHLICIPAAFLMAFSQNLALIGLAFVYFFFLLGTQPVENTLVAVYTPKRLHHSAFGLKFIFTFGVGALAVKLMQKIQSVWGVEASYVALGAISMLIVGTILVLMWRTSPSWDQSLLKPEFPVVRA